MLREIKGSYYPSAFSIFLNKARCNVDITDSTFVHEYIHFLQDLILPYCIRQNMVFIGYFTCILQSGAAHKLVKRPFNQWSSDCLLTAKQTDYTWGRGTSSSGHITNISTESFVTEYGHTVYRYFLKFSDGTSYQLGARDFLEYLAHKIQNKFWTTNPPDLPYKTIDKIFVYFGLESIPEVVRLVIAEYCLHNDNPAHMLINLFFGLNLISNNKNKFMDYVTTSEFLLSTGWVSKGGFNESILTKTSRRLDDFAQRLTAVYPQKRFDSIQNWIIATNQICRTELANKFVLSSLYNLSKEELLNFINHMIDEIGIPLIIFNDNSVTSSLLPETYNSNQFIDFYVMQVFVEWVKGNTRSCPLKDICRVNFKNYQSICNQNPTNVGNACVFNHFLHSFGLDQFPISL